MVVAGRETLWKMNCKIEFIEHLVRLLIEFTGRPELPFWGVLLDKAYRVVGKSKMCTKSRYKSLARHQEGSEVNRTKGSKSLLQKRQFDVSSTVKMLNQVICSGQFYKQLIAEIELNYVGTPLPSSEVGAEVMCCFLKGG